MSRLYAFIWNEMATSRQKIMDELISGPFIFIPYSSISRYDDVVCGYLLSPCEVYWNDSTGTVDQVKEIGPRNSLRERIHSPVDKSLCNIYPGLRGFFVDECRVHDAPPLRSYIHILLQLSTLTLPSQAADKVSSQNVDNSRFVFVVDLPDTSLSLGSPRFPQVGGWTTFWVAEY